jgi:AraC family transcriptional regulator of adaptative response/methylated-DNA-[protein]-cysteine methyltransferase
MLILYGFHPSPFGDYLLAMTTRGICELMFLQEDGEPGAVEHLKSHWKHAQFEHDQDATKKLAVSVFQLAKHEPLPVFLRGTNFQIRVWEALLRIPPGYIVTYKDIALSIGLSSLTGGERSGTIPRGDRPMPQGSAQW